MAQLSRPQGRSLLRPSTTAPYPAAANTEAACSQVVPWGKFPTQSALTGVPPFLPIFAMGGCKMHLLGHNECTQII
eukprot:5959333-Alexandrium_andersonii.AAC.1